MKIYKPLTYVVAAAYLSAIAPEVRADTPSPPQGQYVVQKSKVAAEPSSIDALVLASASTSEHPNADLGITPHKRKHWWNWFYDNWTGRITSTVILGGIGYGVYAATQKPKKTTDTTTPPGTTPITTPPDNGDDKNPGQ